ncbi:7120_t:CDS:2 [Entrophospora sp. SA101]|nr:7120_t:CDS:2 [Entrophospora sp. SA101]
MCSKEYGYDPEYNAASLKHYMTRRRHARTPAAISRRIEQHRLRHRALNLQGSVV